MLKKSVIFTLFFTIYFSFTTSKQAVAKTAKKDNKFSVTKFSDEDDFESYTNENNTETYDPLEKYNRKIFVFNDFCDRYFLEYVAKSYRDTVPKPARNSVTNFLSNLSAPISAFNSFAQGKPDNALATISNFLINSTLGIGGIFNVAEKKNIRYRPEDFGQTLGHYGVNSGAYLMVPFYGPSSVRDFSGFATDQALSPTSYNATQLGGKSYLLGENQFFAISALRTVDAREGLIDLIEDIRKESFDPYATIRSAYLQKRDNDIKN